MLDFQNKLHRRTLRWMLVTVGAGLVVCAGLIILTHWMIMRASEDAYATVLSKQADKTAARVEQYVQSFLVNLGGIIQEQAAETGSLLDTEYAADIVVLERLDTEGQVQGRWTAEEHLDPPAMASPEDLADLRRMKPVLNIFTTNRQTLISIHLPVGGVEFDGAIGAYVDAQTLVWRCFPPLDEPLMAGFTLYDGKNNIIAAFHRPDTDRPGARRLLRTEPLFTEPERGLEAYQVLQGDRQRYLSATATLALPGKTRWRVEKSMLYGTIGLAPRALFKSLVIVTAWLLPLCGFLLLFTIYRLLRTVESEENTRRRSEFEMAQAHLASLIGILPGVVYLAEAEGNQEPLFISNRIQRLTGHQAVELAANPKLWLEIIDPRQREQVVAARQAAISEGCAKTIDYQIRTYAGHTVPVHETATPVRNSTGAPVRLLGIIDPSGAATDDQTDIAGQKPAPGPRGQVLLADDDCLQVSLCARHLAMAGYGITPAYDGMQAVELFRARPDDFVAVILDMIMPRMSGLEAIAHLHKIKPDVKIIGISGYSKDGSEWDLFSNKVSAFLAKPFETEELIGILSKITAPEPKATPAQRPDDYVHQY